MAFHIRLVTENIIAAEAAVHLGLLRRLHNRLGRVFRLGRALLAFMLACVVDFQVAEGVGRVGAMLTGIAPHNGVRLHVTLQVTRLSRLIGTSDEKEKKN